MRIFQRMPRHGVEMGERLRRILTERQGRFVSGEEIAGSLGVTRAAVWKGIRTLRGAGYAIEGARGAGYRMTDRPDRIDEGELREALRPGLPWTDVVCLAVTDSTNRVAMEMAENGAPHGTVVVADEQTAGRGRMGRRWESPPGKNLYVSLLLRPPVPTVEAPRLSLVAGVALADAVEEMGVSPSLKWPNDLYLGERKAAGILAEMASDPDGVRHVVIGVGLNVNMEEADFPPVLRGGATSLRIRAGRTFRRVDVLARMLDAFGTRYGEFLEGGFHALHPGWDRRDFLRGMRVLVRVRGADAWGVAYGVDPEGALRFRRDGGAVEERLHSGEIVAFRR
ncbi:MAG: biotin--[acetyl-CoA-carboxylase] ligase [Deltaproteobacteria bacterium RBG_16_66_15]|nr:MAG: biotin--[acetyl-CoA-carboxylase] ligase [Deltaproteobacteria bacterium GWB2_65_81]OGP79971.1 MAG: biotin--[acetyl-CoA-carboxylase] ligase [Deltaproteobacteria bacterium RBG_16_66_15]